MVKECLLINQSLNCNKKQKLRLRRHSKKQKNKKHPCNLQFFPLVNRTLSTSTTCPRTTTPLLSSRPSSSKRAVLMSSNPKSAETSTSHSTRPSSESTTPPNSRESRPTSAISNSSQSPAALSPTARTSLESIFPSCKNRTCSSERSVRTSSPTIWKRNFRDSEV